MRPLLVTRRAGPPPRSAPRTHTPSARQGTRTRTRPPRRARRAGRRAAAAAAAAVPLAARGAGSWNSSGVAKVEVGPRVVRVRPDARVGVAVAAVPPTRSRAGARRRRAAAPAQLGDEREQRGRREAVVEECGAEVAGLDVEPDRRLEAVVVPFAASETAQKRARGEKGDTGLGFLSRDPSPLEAARPAARARARARRRRGREHAVDDDDGRAPARVACAA